MNAIFDSGRLIYGGLDYKETPSMLTDQSNHEDNSDDATTVDSKVNRVFDKETPIVESEETEKHESNQDFENEKSVSVKLSDLTNTSEDNSIEPSIEEINKETVTNDMELEFQKFEQSISNLASKDDIESINSLINKLSKDSKYEFDKIQNTLKTLQFSAELPTIASEQNDVHILFKSRTSLIAIVCLIVGAVLGALIF